jgi:hypothetical protein
MVIEDERSRSWAYLLVALAGFIAGMALGQLGAMREAGRSRIEWPSTTVAHPRTLQP